MGRHSVRLFYVVGLDRRDSDHGVVGVYTDEREALDRALLTLESLRRRRLRDWVYECPVQVRCVSVTASTTEGLIARAMAYGLSLNSYRIFTSEGASAVSAEASCQPEVNAFFEKRKQGSAVAG